MKVWSLHSDTTSSYRGVYTSLVLSYRLYLTATEWGAIWPRSISRTVFPNPCTMGQQLCSFSLKEGVRIWPCEAWATFPTFPRGAARFPAALAFSWAVSLQLGCLVSCTVTLRTRGPWFKSLAANFIFWGLPTCRMLPWFPCCRLVRPRASGYATKKEPPKLKGMLHGFV